MTARRFGRMIVRELAGRLSYEVKSETIANKWYTVFLEENNGGGICNCTDFSTRKQTALNKGEMVLTDLTACKHIEAAVWHFARTVLIDITNRNNVR